MDALGMMKSTLLDQCMKLIYSSRQSGSLQEMLLHHGPLKARIYRPVPFSQHHLQTQSISSAAERAPGNPLAGEQFSQLD